MGNLFESVLSAMMPPKQWLVRLQLLAGTLAAVSRHNLYN